MRQQRVELPRHGKAGQVEVEPTEVAEHIDVGSEHARERVDPVGDEGEGRAGVRDDQPYIGVAADGAVEHEVHDRPGGVEEELEHRSRPPERCLLPARRRRRVQEHPCAAAIELAEDWIERSRRST